MNKKNCGALRDLVPLVQLKKREKDPWGSFNFSKVAGFSLQPSNAMDSDYIPSQK